MDLQQQQLQQKTARKRVANFTAHEKVLLAQLIKRRPIVQSKLTDNKSVAKKQVAWDLITKEFNSSSYVHKRETTTLKRAWDNMKASARKSHTDGESLNKPQVPSPPLLLETSVNMEEAPSVIVCDVRNYFENDGSNSDAIDGSNSDKLDSITDNNTEIPPASLSNDLSDTLETESNAEIIEYDSGQIEDKQNSSDYSSKKYTTVIKTPDDIQDVVRRIKLENENKVAMETLRTQLEVEQIKKETALLEQQRNKILLERTKIEFSELKKSLEKQQLEVENMKESALIEQENNKSILERTKIELAELRKSVEKQQLEVEQIKKENALLEQERNKILLQKAKMELEELKKSLVIQNSK